MPETESSAQTNDLDEFLAEECQDPEASWIYGYHFGWNDARSLPWWKRLLMRRLSFIADRDWPGRDDRT